MSANSAVTVLRSPSSAVEASGCFDVTRILGVIGRAGGALAELGACPRNSQLSEDEKGV